METGLCLLLVFTFVWSTCAGADCPPGWVPFQRSCYIYINDAYTWLDASKECEILRGHLVEIYSEEENNFVANLSSSHGGRNVWLGLEDFAVENTFVWATSQEEAEYVAWLPHEPNNHQGHEDCGYMIVHVARWNDGPCVDSHFTFVCQAPVHGGGLIG